jgi:glycosyltransferase involved in cell wall biosynthesis
LRAAIRSRRLGLSRRADDRCGSINIVLTSSRTTCWNWSWSSKIHPFRHHPLHISYLHFLSYLHFPLLRRQPTPHLTTLHGRLDLPDLVPLYQECSEVPVVSISKAQREPLPWLDWQGNVHHGLPDDLYRLHQTPGQYLAFLERIWPQKRIDRAIEIAKRSNREIKIAAKVDEVDRTYCEDVVVPLLRDP